MKKIAQISISLLTMAGVWFAAAQTAIAQCAMCRATVENNLSSGDSSIGAGLNAGILYLMMMPYILIAIVAYFWYKRSKVESQKRDYIDHVLRSKLSIERE